MVRPGEYSGDLFQNGVDAWVTVGPVSPARTGILVITGNTSLPAGTPLSVSVVTAAMHPTPNMYDWSHEMADRTTMVLPGTAGRNRHSCAVDVSKLNRGQYLIGVGSRGDFLQADARGAVYLVRPVMGDPV